MDEKEIRQASYWLPRVEKAFAASGMTATRFGYLHFGDPGFLKRLRKGGAVHKRTIDKIQNVLALFE